MGDDPLLQRLAKLNWPRPAMDRPTPAAGQLWRATWGDAAGLVLLLGAAQARTVPVAFANNQGEGDEASVTVPTDQSFSPVVWGAIRSELKMFTLDYRLADVLPSALVGVEAVIAGRRRGEWGPIDSPLDDRALQKADVIDERDRLIDVDWLPAVTGAKNLAERAEALGLTASTLAREVGIAPGAARRLLQGQRDPSPVEKAFLERELGSPVTSGVQY